MEDDKLSGRIIIETILANMRQQVEELRYSKVVPAAYDVYLHAEDQQRFEILAHEIAAEAVRALQERLELLNRPSRLDRARDLIGRSRLPYKKVGPWLVRITRDPDGAVPLGRALVVSQIALAGAEAFDGQRTRRLATLSEPAGETAAPEALMPAPAAPAPVAVVPAETRATESAETREIAIATATVLATVAWEDQAGPHRYRMTSSELTIGREAQGSTADVRLDTLPDVSRLHARVRHHPEDGRFTIEDLSMLGTTVNGEPLTRGTPRELPSPSDIRLAETITLRFESGAPS
jgi:FHA domain-containing protein